MLFFWLKSKGNPELNFYNDMNFTCIWKTSQEDNIMNDWNKKSTQRHS